MFQPALCKNGELIWIHNLRDKFDNDTLIVSNIENELIHLNHYPIQSLEYFKKIKMTRGDAGYHGSENVRNMEYFQNYDKDQTFKDELLKNIVENPPENY
jgi:hypothetical protein